MAHEPTHKLQDFNQYIGLKFQDIGNGLLLKLGITATIAVPTSIFGIDLQVIVGLCVMGVIDFVTGLVRAKKKGEVISSKKMLNTGYKAILYGSLILASFLVAQVFPEYAPIHQWSALFLFLVEFHSVIENITEGGVILPKEISNWLKKMMNTHK